MLTVVWFIYLCIYWDRVWLCLCLTYHLYQQKVKDYRHRHERSRKLWFLHCSSEYLWMVWIYSIWKSPFKLFPKLLSQIINWILFEMCSNKPGEWLGSWRLKLDKRQNRKESPQPCSYYKITVVIFTQEQRRHVLKKIKNKSMCSLWVKEMKYCSVEKYAVLHVLTVFTSVSSGFSSFLPPPNDMGHF